MIKIQKISIDLADKYSTAPEIISYIRSCHRNLKLSRKDIILRQTDKINITSQTINGCEKAIEKRLKQIERYPEQKEFLETKIQNIKLQKELLPKGVNKRMALKHFLEQLTEEEFNKIVTAK